MIDYVILAVVAAALAFTAFRLISRRQKGESHCAGCSGCAHASSCASLDEAQPRH